MGHISVRETSSNRSPLMAVLDRFFMFSYIVETPPCTPEKEGDIRLVDGRSKYEGRVEVFHAMEWGTICDRHWNDKAAAVICRQLGFPVIGKSAGGGGELPPLILG